MTNSVRILLLACVAIAAFFALPSPARADDCVVTPGRYSLTWGRDGASQRNMTGLKQVVKSTLYGDLSMDVACDGTVKLLTTDAPGIWSYTAIATPSGMSGQTTSLNMNIKMHFAVIGKATKGLNNFPNIVLQVNSDAASCPDANNALCPHGAAEVWHLNGTDIETDSKIFQEVSGHGPFNAIDAAHAGDMSPNDIYLISHSKVAYPPQADRPGFSTGSRDGYTIVLVNQPPSITVSKDIQDVFLDDVPSVIIELRAHIDSWGTAGAKGSEVTMDFENYHFKVSADKLIDNMLIENVEVGNLKAGTHNVMVTATNLGGLKFSAPPYPIVVIPTPPWARKLKNFSSQGIDKTCYTECVVYQGTKGYPADPLSFGVDIPDIVPFIGGQWGLRNTQFAITPRPRTRFGEAQGNITGNAFFALGQKTWSIGIEPGSEVTTTTTGHDLEFTHGHMQFADVDTEFTKHIGLLSLFATLGDAIPINGVGDFIRKHDAAGVDGTISAGVHKSTLEFGAKPTDQDITISKFTAQLDVNVKIQATVDLLIAGGAVMGDVDGTLDMSLSPSPKVDDCHLNYTVALAYKFATYVGVYPDPIASHPITSCKTDPTAYAPPIQRLTNALAMANRGSLFATAEAASPSQATAGELKIPARNATILDRLAERSAQGAAQRIQTTLVDGAAGNVAAPAVAAGPGGKLALAWIGENLGAARPQAWQTQVRIFDGTRWAKTAPIIGDGKRPNSSPSIAYDGNGNLVMAYEVNTTPGLTASTPVEKTLPNLQIEVVTADGTTGAVTSRRIVSSGAGPHLRPQAVTAGDGSVWIAWQTVASTDIMTSTAPAKISAVHWNRSALSAPEVLVQNAAGLEAWQLAARDGSAAVLGIDTADASGKRTIHAVERSASGWKETFAKGAAARTGAALATGYVTDGSAQLLWSDGDTIVAETHGDAKTLIASITGNPSGVANDATSTSVLITMPGGGFNTVRVDAKSGKAEAPVALSRSQLSLSPAGIAHGASGWITAIAQTPAITSAASFSDGAPIIVNTAAPPKKK